MNVIKAVASILNFLNTEELTESDSSNGLKFLSSNQMLSRLPLSLAQLILRNNSEKFKNEIRQLLYSLYRSKKRTKQLYKSLFGIM